MTKLGVAIERLQGAELELAHELRQTGERHAVEHDIFHLTKTLATQCEKHLERLVPFADRYEAQREHDPEADGPGLLGAFRRKAAKAIGRQPTGLVLLDDLRELFLSAQDVGVLWVMVGQAAQAKRDQELLDTCKECHTESIAQMHWLLTRIKESAPQALTVSPSSLLSS
jgi:hypothetical protein